MSKFARDRRKVDRGFRNVETVRSRNGKDSRQFDRWFSGQLVEKRTVRNCWGGRDRVVWDLQPRGQGLIHKGRKP